MFGPSQLTPEELAALTMQRQQEGTNAVIFYVAAGAILGYVVAEGTGAAVGAIAGLALRGTSLWERPLA
jgi:phage-related tail protein